MRICYVADGTSIHTQRWVNYQARRGHESHLICLGVLSGYDQKVHIYPLTWLGPRRWTASKYISAWLWVVQVRRLIKRIKPDIVDAHFVTSYGFLAAGSGFHPLVITTLGSDVLINPKKNFLFKVITKYALERADGITYDSEFVKERLTRLHVELSRMRLILKGVDTKQFSSQQRSPELRSQLALSNSPTVISIRSLKPIYNVEMLIRAIPIILNQVPETKFIIVGDGEQKDYLSNLASSRSVSNSIRFAGLLPHDEVPKYLASSDVYVSTSISDSCPVSLQEAMACELAPVVTDIPANRAWIADGKNGFLVPINDVEKLADEVVYLIRNRPVREQFGNASRQIIQEKAEYEREMSKLEEFYEELIKATAAESRDRKT